MVSNLRRKYCLYAFLVLVGILGNHCSQTAEKQVVENGSFENEGDGRPQYWYYGFVNEPLDPAQGTIGIDDSHASQGHRCLRINPTSDQGPFVSQVLHAPTFDLAGKTVRLRIDIRTDSLRGGVFALLVAVNPELPKDPEIDAPSAGKALIMATSEGKFSTQTASFIAFDKAQMLVLAVGAAGTSGTAYIDNVQVTMEIPEPGPGPDPEMVEGVSLIDRNFPIGVTSENPIDYSEKAHEDLIEKATEIGEMVNLFFHIRYNALIGKDLLSGHKPLLAVAKHAQRWGLFRAVTLDFTHASLDGLGDLNPLPNGTSVDSLTQEVQNAYLDELKALCAFVKPNFVFVGIEVDIFHDKHSDQWSDYVNMYKNAYSSIKGLFPTCHVTTYFTLPWMVNKDGGINKTHKKLWQMLLPELDSVAYSTYPSVDDWRVEDIPEGFFTAAREVAPDRPLAICEFGMRSDAEGGFSEFDQAEVLRRILLEVGPTQPAFLIWYSLYDQLYLGANIWFKQSFSSIGLRQLDGTPKQSWVILQKLAGQNNATIETVEKP